MKAHTRETASGPTAVKSGLNELNQFQKRKAIAENINANAIDHTEQK